MKKLLFVPVLAVVGPLVFFSCNRTPQVPTPAQVIKQDHTTFQERPALKLTPIPQTPSVEHVASKQCRRVTVDTTKDPYWSGVKGPLHALRCDPARPAKAHKRPKLKPAVPVVPQQPLAPTQPRCPIANLPCPWRTN